MFAKSHLLLIARGQRSICIPPVYSHSLLGTLEQIAQTFSPKRQSILSAVEFINFGSPNQKAQSCSSWVSGLCVLTTIWECANNLILTTQIGRFCQQPTSLWMSRHYSQSAKNRSNPTGKKRVSILIRIGKSI